MYTAPQKSAMFIPSGLIPPGYSIHRQPEPAPAPLVVYNSTPAPAPVAPLDPVATAEKIAEYLAPTSIAKARAESHAATTAAAAEAAWSSYNEHAKATYEAAERARIERQALENVRARNKANELSVLEQEAKNRLAVEFHGHGHGHGHGHTRSRSCTGDYEYSYRHHSRSRSRHRHGRSVSRESRGVVVIEQHSVAGSDAGGWEEVEPRPVVLQIEAPRDSGRSGRRGYYEHRPRRSVQYIEAEY